MKRSLRKKSKKPGLPPGTLIHVGKKRTIEPRITVIDYDDSDLQEKEIRKIDECYPFKDKPTVTWINVDGIHDVEIVDIFESEGRLVVEILYTEPNPGDMVTEAVTQPHHIVTTPKSDLPVEFRWEGKKSR